MQYQFFYKRLFLNVTKRRGGKRAALRLLVTLLFFIALMLPSQIAAATLPANFTETSVGGISSPTAFAIHLDGRIFVCQQSGELRVIKNGALLATPFVTVSTSLNGERGLLGIAFDPNYATNHYVYVYYTVTAGSPAVSHNRVSRFTADITNEDVAVAGSEFPILDLDDLSTATNHNGGPIHFGPDGKLYIGVGENANGANAQSITNRLGKMLRINSDGTIPSDNPTTFPGITGSTSGLNRAIFTVGQRNPFTFAFQPGTGKMFTNDVGNNTWEEIDNSLGGKNYGWPTCEGSWLNGSTTTHCTDANFTNPAYDYSSAVGTTCAITGGDFYNPTTPGFPSLYAGKYFFADYCAGWIMYIDPVNPPVTGGATGFATGISSPVDIHTSNDGSLYYLSQGSSALFRIQFLGTPSPTPTSTPTNTATSTPTNTPTNTPTASPTPPATSISGTVTYGNALGAPSPRPVSNVTISGAGSPNVSTITSFPDGTYSLSGFGSGSYTVTPSKIGGINGITSFDAAKIAQHAAGVDNPPLTATQLIVADVSGNGSVTSFDAAQVAGYAVGTPPFGNSGNWIFVPVNRMYASITSSMTGQDYSALLMGEVSGNWTDGSPRPALDAPEQGATVAAPRLVTPADGEVLIPVSVDGIADKGIISYEFDLRYDSSVIQPQANPVDLAGTASSRLSVVANAQEAGLIRVAVYGATPVTGSGVLFTLRFTAVGAPGSVSPLTWERFILNEGIEATAAPGQIELSAAAPNQAEITGRLLTPMGMGIPHARVTQTDTAGKTHAILSNGFGVYRFGGLQVGETYTISVESRRFNFVPAMVSVADQLTSVGDMIAAP